ncbi:Protein of unknown function [Gryllus bimaculatus]|nr:Protein of unknown function [Gryllus bimaculatus]
MKLTEVLQNTPTSSADSTEICISPKKALFPAYALVLAVSESKAGHLNLFPNLVIDSFSTTNNGLPHLSFHHGIDSRYDCLCTEHFAKQQQQQTYEPVSAKNFFTSLMDLLYLHRLKPIPISTIFCQFRLTNRGHETMTLEIRRLPDVGRFQAQRATRLPAAQDPRRKRRGSLSDGSAAPTGRPQRLAANDSANTEQEALCYQFNRKTLAHRGLTCVEQTTRNSPMVPVDSRCITSTLASFLGAVLAPLRLQESRGQALRKALRVCRRQFVLDL